MNNATQSTASTQRSATVSGYLRLPDILELVPVSKATLYRWIAAGEFPRQRRLTRTGSTVAWSTAQVHAWLESNPATNDGTYVGTSVGEVVHAA
jgi:prophage regulatory protein